MKQFTGTLLNEGFAKKDTISKALTRNQETYGFITRFEDWFPIFDKVIGKPLPLGLDKRQPSTAKGGQANWYRTNTQVAPHASAICMDRDTYIENTEAA